jgi:hypothetical protein
MISALIGILLGYYFTYVSTWEIKDKINVLDKMSSAITDLGDLLNQSCLQKNNIKYCKQLFIKVLFVYRPILNTYLSQSAREILNEMKSNYDEINWNRGNGKCDQFAAELMAKFSFEENQVILYKELVKAREKIISLKNNCIKLFCNLPTLFVILSCIVMWLGYKYFLDSLAVHVVNISL